MVTSLFAGTAVPLWDRALVQAMKDATLGVWEEPRVHNIAVVNANGETYRQVIASGPHEYDALLRCFAGLGFEACLGGGQIVMHPSEQEVSHV
jgi:hypothetical protein